MNDYQLSDQFVVSYTNDDDGIWLRHVTCGWWHHLGFEPSVSAIFIESKQHQQVCAAISEDAR